MFSDFGSFQIWEFRILEVFGFGTLRFFFRFSNAGGFGIWMFWDFGISDYRGFGFWRFLDLGIYDFVGFGCWRFSLFGNLGFWNFRFFGFWYLGI